ncbi:MULTISPECIES: bifunctional aldolase/short-chain dehydrogenase [Mesonia]|uniref:Dihydroanticapsin 7-dehydrogenase n=1 Tax=Mesonia oceanica TaxID=2687242 RepID=A0AC61Y8G7_9FLAO|nr:MULTISPECIES: bifunctional aldolase/short-chain dehydrogenase [Mesonia]MAN27043.1 bifunctional rhamnulose-1-phosphate aldolase/short-chain dehydrogenase [Mesonia sp.]MAQ41447.1 bifunctional rhamnulose-1-phosphate aldolase/short-chain dehydrogenase [Mesonia sp.]VVV00448.1 Dihydroanticapsin 7-dehydrogenase [Mesonia oceanica]|tara:strand:- start:2372 stop:4468 length:2097 start_codon:yes stop_codon:yes gene_type:complete
MKKTFQYVDYLWDEAKAAELGDDQVALFLYRSNILGADLRITNYGGGNTSCKTIEKDPLTNEEVEVMWVKGSGGDIGTLTRKGIAGLYTERLRNLKNVYGGLEDEDRMVGLFNHCIYDLDSKAPSIDTPLHGLLPFKHIDHLHPDALIAVAAAKDSEQVTKEIWGDTMGWVPWQRPGFDLGLQLEKCLNENPGIRGIVLGSHGLFTWGDTSYECYVNSLEVIEMASEYIEKKIKENGEVFGGQKIEALPAEERKEKAAELMPLLRGLASSENQMIGHFTDSDTVLQYINSNDLERLAPMGTSCPDHFLRTKIQPLILTLDPSDEVIDTEATLKKLEPSFEQYREEYLQYYENHKHANSPAMRDPNPVIIIYPGVGMFSFAKNKQTTRVASEFYVNAINVMRGAEAISEYTSLPRQEAFDIEYWLLEEAKLQRMPAEKPLSRKVAIVTGAAGGIGKAIADKLVAEGANVVLTDISQENLEEALATYKRDEAAIALCDVTKEESIEKAYKEANLAFGGVDIVVHSAGLAISKSLPDTTLKDWELLQNVLVKGQFLMAQKGVEIMRKQGLGGDIVNIASKNGLVSGPNNVGYGTAKAAQQHMTRLLAAELGGDHIRVNTVNPDGVIVGSKIWEGDWAEGRAKAHGIKVEDLPAHYAKRNLLNEIILPEDIANGVFACVGILEKSTGNTINVDGGMANAFVR